MVNYEAPKNSEPKFKRISQITVPVLSTKGGKTVYVYILDKLKQREETDRLGQKKTNEDGTPKTITIADVVDLIEKNHCHMIVGTVLESEITRHYAAHEYIGRSFEINIPRDVEAGKKYKVPKIIEIETPENIDDILKNLLPPTSKANIEKRKK